MVFSSESSFDSNTEYFSDSEEDDEIVVSVEDADGWHIDSGGNQFCIGCDTCADDRSVHCTACNNGQTCNN